jgi:hypothetical protein
MSGKNKGGREVRKPKQIKKSAPKDGLELVRSDSPKKPKGTI